MTTTAAETTNPVEWEKPGPGSWQRDSSHFEPDCSRLAQAAITRGMTAGTHRGFETIGAPVKGMEAAFVRGNFYYRIVPLVAGNSDLPLPPAPILWLLTRIHPTFRRQSKRAAASLKNRVWNDELAAWEATDRPNMFGRCQTLTAEDPTTMTDPELAGHLDRVVELLFDGATMHFRLHASDLGPIGLLLFRARQWGLDQVEVMATLAGSSPATSAPGLALAAIKRAAGPGPFDSLDQVRSASAEAAGLLDDYLAEYGWRLTTGYDLQELTLAELPDVIVNSINGAKVGDDDSPTTDNRDAGALGQQAFERLRRQLGEDHRAEFEQLVGDARALYGLRDENGPLTWQWPAGLARRAMLEAGRRLEANGSLLGSDHVFDLEPDEISALVAGRSGPSPEAVADRCLQRQSWKTFEAPRWLGPEPEDPPPGALPGPLAEMMNVILVVLEMIETQSTVPTLDGIGIGSEPLVGTARVVTDELDALSRMEPGDVLIAPFTVPTYNAVLATAGAVVVENGGLLCHAAVIAREYGIPGLVGVTGVTSQITDGATVRVDPAAGTIRELSTESAYPAGPVSP